MWLKKVTETIKSPLDLPQYAEALARERFNRDVSFLDVNETIAGYTVRPMTLRHYLALRILQSPMIPPYRTPGPFELVAFLWLLSPQYDREDETARREFVKTCKPFLPPREGIWSTIVHRLFPERPKPEPKLKNSEKESDSKTGGASVPASHPRRLYEFLSFGLNFGLKASGVILRHWLRTPRRRFEKRQAAALLLAAKILAEAREYVTEAMADKPARNASDGIPEPDYYSDACAVTSQLAREKHFAEAAALDMPLKRLFQHLKEIRDRNNHQVPAIDRIPLGNPSDKVINDYLTGANRQN